MKHDSIITLKFSQLLDTTMFPYRNKNFVLSNRTASNQLISLHQVYKSEYFGVMLMEEGSSYYSVGDYRYELHKGDILFTVPEEIFKIHYMSKDVKVKHFFFTLQMVIDAGFNYRTNDIIKSFSTHPSYLIKGEEKLYLRLRNYVDDLAALNDIRNPMHYANEMIWHLFSVIMYEIEEFFRQSKSKRTTSSREEVITTEFYSLVQAYYKQNHDVTFYADKLSISRKYLTKVIKNTMGRTPKDIINQVILIEAKVMLKQPGVHISLVADELHFKDTTTFSKFFKKMTAVSPSDYRAQDLF